MNINLINKILVLGIILLLMGVSYSTAFTIDSKISVVNNLKKENCDCEKTLNLDLIKIKRLVNKVKTYSNILPIFSKYKPEIKDRCNKIISDINTLDSPICDLIEPIYIIIFQIRLNLEELISEYQETPAIVGILLVYLAIVIALEISFIGLMYSFNCVFIY